MQHHSLTEQQLLFSQRHSFESKKRWIGIQMTKVQKLKISICCWIYNVFPKYTCCTRLFKAVHHDVSKATEGKPPNVSLLRDSETGLWRTTLSPAAAHSLLQTLHLKDLWFYTLGNIVMVQNRVTFTSLLWFCLFKISRLYEPDSRSVFMRAAMFLPERTNSNDPYSQIEILHISSSSSFLNVFAVKKKKKITVYFRYRIKTICNLWTGKI